MKKILIIEDDLSIAHLERDFLEAEGFTVSIIAQGDQGLNLIKAENFDLVILDLMLPGVDGFEICRRIRLTHDLPILIVSAREEEISKIRGFGLGGDDYITKPFSPTELVARVKAHLARYSRISNREGSKNVLEIKNLRIDQRSRRVFINNKEIMLTTKEYDLLAFLANHPEQAFTKDEIYERVWGMESFGDSSNVTVFISKLRDKIEPYSTGPHFIETLWGVGYRFVI